MHPVVVADVIQDVLILVLVVHVKEHVVLDVLVILVLEIVQLGVLVDVMQIVHLLDICPQQCFHVMFWVLSDLLELINGYNY